MNKRNDALTAKPEGRKCALSGRVVGIPLLVVLLALSHGCSLLQTPQHVVTAFVPTDRSNQPDPVDVQVQVQRFADDYAARSADAIDEYGRQVGTTAARLDTLKWKLTTVSSAVSIASGPNPMANMLDLVALATLSRAVLEDYWVKTTNGAAFHQWLDASRLLETNAWIMAAAILKPNQLDELHNAIAQWQSQHPDASSALFARPQELAAMVKTEGAKGGDQNSVFSLVGLDPTAGLDPAVREITRTRLFAERAMFTLQRMPFIIRWQTELLAWQLTDQPNVQIALTNVSRLAESADRMSRATESVSQTVALLPDRISTERKAILAALDQQEGKLKDLTAQVDRALESGEKMSTSLNTTIGTFSALMKLFGVGQPDTNSLPDTNSPPFNILDYGQVADHVGSMAREINTLVASVNQSVPQLDRLSQQASSDAEKVVNRGFRLGLVLIAVLLTGAVLAGLVYRYFAEKLKRPGILPPA